MSNASPHYKIILAAIILVSAFLSLLRFNSFPVGAFPDDAHYIVLAESISQGEGYRLINFPFAPIDLAFPPGWPILLSPLVALLPGNYSILKLLSFVFWLASIFLTYRLIARRFGSPYLEISLALVALHPALIGFSGMVMSEMAYLFFSLITLILFESWRKQEKSNNWLLVVVTILAIYTQLIRAVGLAILISLVFYLLFSRRFKQLGIVLVIVAIGMIPQLWLYSQTGGSLISSGYQTQALSGTFTAKLTHMGENVQAYGDQMISGMLIPVFGPPDTQGLHNSRGTGAYTILNVIVLLLIGLGFVSSLRRFHICDLYVGFYFLGILSFWNPDAGGAQHRFLIPIVPLLYFYLIQAMKWLTLRIFRQDEKRAGILVTAMAGLVIMFSLSANIMDCYHPMRSRMTDLSIGADWISKNSPEESIVMTKNPVSVYLYARRKTIPYPFEKQDVEKYIATSGVDYIIVSPGLKFPQGSQGANLDQFIQTRMIPLVESKPERFKVAYTNAVHQVTVYECSNIR